MEENARRHPARLPRAAAAAVALAALFAAPAAMPQDLSVAGGKIAVCVTCHGATGNTDNPIYPNLAGQHAEYLVKSMTAYRDGAREDPLMSPMAAGLTDGEIQELATYYSQQKP